MKKKMAKSSQVSKGRRKPAPKKPREYRREFTRSEGDEGHTIKIKYVPTPFWLQVRKKADKEGISISWKVLRFLREWVEEDRQAS